MAISDEDNKMLNNRPKKVNDLAKLFRTDNKTPEESIIKKRTGEPSTTYYNLTQSGARNQKHGDTENAQILANQAADKATQSHQNDAAHNQDTQQLTQITSENATPSTEQTKKKNKQHAENMRTPENQKHQRKSKNRPSIEDNKIINIREEEIRSNNSVKRKNSQRARAVSDINLDVNHDKNHFLTDAHLLRNNDPEIKQIRKIFIKLCEDHDIKYEQKTNSLFIVDTDNRCYINELALDLLKNTILKNDIEFKNWDKRNGQPTLLDLFVKRLNEFAVNQAYLIDNDKRDEIKKISNAISEKRLVIIKTDSESESDSSGSTKKTKTKRSPTD